jgi:hypothetical protein
MKKILYSIFVIMVISIILSACEESGSVPTNELALMEIDNEYEDIINDEIVLYPSINEQQEEPTNTIENNNYENNMENKEIRTVYSEGQWPDFDSVESLFNRATDVVRVEVLDNGRYEMVNTRIPEPENPLWEPRFSIYTLHQVRVIEIFNGDLIINDIIDIGQYGGEMDGVRLITDAQIPFMEGDDLILFLTIYDGIYHAELLTPWYAIYHYPKENNIMSFSADSEDNRVLENVDERNQLTLTVGDLYNRRETE